MIINWDNPKVKSLVFILAFVAGFLLAILLAGMSTPYISPDDFGAIHKNKTCGEMGWSQNKIDRKFKGVGAKPYWQVDRAAIQKSVNAQSEHKKIILLNGVYYLDSMLYIDGNQPYMKGNDVEFHATTNGSWAFIGRRKLPTTKGEMEAMFSDTRMTVTGIRFFGTGQTQGIQANSVRFATILNNEFINTGGWAIAANFAMYADIHGNTVTGGANGIKLGLAIPGVNESSSNLARVTQNQTHSVRDTAFANFYAYEAKFDQNTIEGNGDCKVGFYGTLASKTTAKEMDLGTWHLEQSGTAAIAWFRLNLREQIVRIRLPNVHDATNGILIHAESSAGAVVYLEDLIWYNEVIYFKSKDVTWNFAYCRAIGSNKNTMWYVGNGYLAPKEGTPAVEGNNSYQIVASQYKDYTD